MICWTLPDFSALGIFQIYPEIFMLGNAFAAYISLALFSCY